MKAWCFISPSKRVAMSVLQGAAVKWKAFHLFIFIIQPLCLNLVAISLPGIATAAKAQRTVTVTGTPSSKSPGDQETFKSTVMGGKFVLIPAGTFMMGAQIRETEADGNETQHQVTISRPFYMQTTEVTQGQWKMVTGNNPSHFISCGDECPVEQVSWNDAQKFIRKLNTMEGTDKYRLPTEAEWEYAARAGTTTRFYWGNRDDCSRANYGNGFSPECKGTNPGKTMKVGSFAPNAWGLYDMHGNVLEWVQDWKGNYPAGNATDPQGPASGLVRVFRGGSWIDDAKSCRSAVRGVSDPDSRYDLLGFRLLRAR
jgi:formylglycine-generating enzyme required for sulfatase activity